jgi:Ca-activated chloride channel family protein
VRAHFLAVSLLSCLLVGLAFLTGCGGSTASYARFRRAASEGAIVAAEEVRAADFIDVHAEEDAPRPPPGVTTLPILLDARMGASTVAVTGGRAVVQISLRGGVAALRAPANVVVVLDVSGSMQDQDKIGAVRQALARFVEGLDARDRIAIVTFSDDAHVALMPTEVGPERSTILSAVGDLRAYGATNLGAGLERGLELAQRMQGYGGNARLVVLSDGVATMGETRADQLVHYADAARARTIAMTTIGMGEQIDFGLLEALANGAGGAFHYVDRPAEVERVFGRELSALTGIAARDAHVRIMLPPGATLARSYDERTRQSGSELDTPLGDVCAGEALVIVHEIDLAPGTGVVSIPVQVTLGSLDRASAAIAQTALTVTRSGYVTGSATDASVLRNVTLGRIAWSVREASHLVDTGETIRAGGFAHGALAEANAARAALLAMGDATRASSLDEAIALLGRTASLLPDPTTAPATGQGGWSVTSSGSTSAAFAGWR